MGHRPPRPRRALTLRARLALTFSALVVLFGAGTLGVTYLLVAQILPKGNPPAVRRLLNAPGPYGPPGGNFRHFHALIGPALRQQQGQMLEHLLLGSALALLVLVLVVAVTSWGVADRALGPLRTITDTARRLSMESLGDRIALKGPQDELKELADTFDGMLARLERAFQDQRQFVANASHELRTPLAVSRSLLEVARADPSPTLAGWQETAESLLQANARMERLISSLLLLARGESGQASEPANFDDLAVDAVVRLPPGAPRLRHRLRPAPVQGDPMLLQQMIGNLLENAARYNVPGGFVSLATGTRGGEAFARVSNSGPPLRQEDLPDLLLPFHRLGAQRTDPAHSSGLGLAIVAAIARAHGGRVELAARRAGGLSATVLLPRRS